MNILLYMDFFPLRPHVSIKKRAMIKRKIKKLRKILKALFGWITLCFFLNKGRSRLFFIKDFLEKKN